MEYADPEATSVAWSNLGWCPVAFAEIEPFPAAVLKHRFPGIKNLGDIRNVLKSNLEFDLLVGGTPCQSFSVAGLRKGLEDERGNIALEFMRIVAEKRPEWAVWKSVPGVLSSNRGRDFGSILGALAHCGYSFARHILDARYFGVPQRRRRVFLVGHSGRGGAPARVLFESEGVSGDTKKTREKRKEDSGTTGKSFDSPICVEPQKVDRASDHQTTVIAASPTARSDPWFLLLGWRSSESDLGCSFTQRAGHA